MKRLAAVLVVLLLGLSAPSIALAQFGGPQNVPEGLTPPDDETAAPVEEEDTGLTTRQLVLIFGGAIGVLALIAWLIMRDARGAAPAAERGRSSSSSSTSGSGAATKKSARERERERARKRNKAKAARDQRKRNRPR